MNGPHLFFGKSLFRVVKCSASIAGGRCNKKFDLGSRYCDWQSMAELNFLIRDVTHPLTAFRGTSLLPQPSGANLNECRHSFHSSPLRR